jgi:hypothetical protein
MKFYRIPFPNDVVFTDQVSHERHLELEAISLEEYLSQVATYASANTGPPALRKKWARLTPEQKKEKFELEQAEKLRASADKRAEKQRLKEEKIAELRANMVARRQPEERFYVDRLDLLAIAAAGYVEGLKAAGSKVGDFPDQELYEECMAAAKKSIISWFEYKRDEKLKQA